MNNKLKKQKILSLLLGMSISVGCPVSAVATGLSLPGVSQTQKRTLAGTVIDGFTGEPLIGVNIKIKGTGQGTITDFDGKFSLQVDDKTQLEVSYIGYAKQTIMVGDLGVITIKMSADTEMIGEVVVVGAGTQKKISVTGAIESVSGDVLKSPSSSLTNALAGQLSGIVSTVSSGEPGKVSDFYIRGINTFGSNSLPLILLDGIEIDRSELNNVPAESIESFTILKDASATAIYGNKGANGVMLITTKSGKENSKAKVNVSLDVSYFKPINMVEFADAPTFMRKYNEAAQARSSSTIFEPKFTEEQIINTEKGLNPYVYPNVDWYGLLFKKGSTSQRANINISGGGSRVTYYMSLQANHDTGLLNIPKNYILDNNINHWTYNFQNNISYKITNTTTVNLRMMTLMRHEKGPSTGTHSIYNTVMQSNPVAFPAYFPMGEDEDWIRYGTAEIKAGRYAPNPYQMMLKDFNEYNGSTVTTTLGLNQNLNFITKGLSFRAVVNFRNFSSTSYNRSIEPYLYAVDLASFDEETGEHEPKLLKEGTRYINQSGITRKSNQTFYFDAKLNWKRRFGKHNTSAMLMYMQREFRSEQLPNRNQGFSGRATYNYDNKYLVEFNFGYNGSERLAKGDRFEFFPAASLGWVVSSEDFWKPLNDIVDHLKLRTSYGLVGSDGFIGPHFAYVNEIGVGNGYGFTSGLPGISTISKGGASFNKMAVQNAGWEHVKKFDIGVDMRLFNQLRLSFDYFRDYRDRILMQRASWPKLLGFWGSTPLSNIGAVLNQGFEASINWKNKIGKDWWVDCRANFTYNQNEYIHKDEPDFPYVWRTQTGKPINRITGYISEGLFTSKEEIDSWPDQSQISSSRLMPGDIKYRDINGDGQITPEDQVMLSSYGWRPRIQYGFGISISYKKWYLGAFFNGSAMRKIMINSGYSPFLSTGGDGITDSTVERNLMQWIADSHWNEQTQNPNAIYPRLGTTKDEISNNVLPSSYWLRNGNFLRFKSLQLGYNFKYINLYLSADNLAVFSPFKLWDPELSWNAYPLQRTFNVGVKFHF